MHAVRLERAVGRLYACQHAPWAWAVGAGVVPLLVPVAAEAEVVAEVVVAVA